MFIKRSEKPSRGMDDRRMISSGEPKDSLLRVARKG
jgi:hypothetical protein